jgi:hypothetical protein
MLTCESARAGSWKRSNGPGPCHPAQAARRRAAILCEEAHAEQAFKLVAVALANKMARIAFAIMRGRTSYCAVSA